MPQHNKRFADIGSAERTSVVCAHDDVIKSVAIHVPDAGHRVSEKDIALAAEEHLTVRGAGGKSCQINDGVGGQGLSEYNIRVPAVATTVVIAVMCANYDVS